MSDHTYHLPLPTISAGRSEWRDPPTSLESLKKASYELKDSLKRGDFELTWLSNQWFGEIAPEDAGLQKVQRLIAQGLGSRSWKDLTDEVSTGIGPHLRGKVSDELLREYVFAGLRNHASADLIYSEPPIRVIRAGIQYLKRWNALGTLLTTDAGVVVAPGAHRLPPGSPLDRAFEGTGLELLDREVLFRLRMPRPWAACDYDGASSSPAYVSRRVQLGILSDQEAMGIAATGISRRFGGVLNVRSIQNVSRAAAVMTDLMDEAYRGNDLSRVSITLQPLWTDIHDLVVEILSAPEVSDLSDCDMLVLEQLRFADWIFSRIVRIAWFIEPHDLANYLGEIVTYLGSALRIIEQSQRVSIYELEYATSNDNMPIAPPNAVRLVGEGEVLR